MKPKKFMCEVCRRIFKTRNYVNYGGKVVVVSTADNNHFRMKRLGYEQ